MIHSISLSSFFFFNDTATTEIYTLSLHDALPIYSPNPDCELPNFIRRLFLPENSIELFFRSIRIASRVEISNDALGDRKSTRLNSSHLVISYAVFCLKKKKKYQLTQQYANEVRHT